LEQNGVPPLPSLDAVADPENLIRVFRELSHRAGQAPGPDGLTYADLGRGEAAGLLRGLGQAIRAGTYRPGPGRRVRIPKSGAMGHRVLTVRGILDRVVAAALNERLTPYWEPLFLPGSFGFRPRRGVWHALARLERAMTQQDRWVLATEDIRDAFGSVVLDDVLADHRRHLADPGLLRLLEVVLRGTEDGSPKTGIDQGNAYSPTALNVRLHFAHDRGFGPGPLHPPWLRYADNVVYACQSVSEGIQALNHARHLLARAGFSLKGEDGPPRDLRQGHRASLLGFVVSCREGQVAYALGKYAWDGLAQSLVRAHEAEDPSQAARTAVLGWVNAYGPALASLRSATPGRVLTTAASLGFREVTTSQELRERWEASYRRWCALRRAYGSEGGERALSP
jgi:hypothetical protein